MSRRLWGDPLILPLAPGIFTPDGEPLELANSISGRAYHSYYSTHSVEITYGLFLGLRKPTLATYKSVTCLSAGLSAIDALLN